MATDNTSSESPHVMKALEYLNSVLVKGETLDAWSIQRRLFALAQRRVLIAATSGRFIKISRGILGGFEMTDFRWQDLGDARIKVGIFGADIFMKIFPTADLAISKNSSQDLILKGFRKEGTQQIYRLAQAQDQSWREKRRIRELEELRAKSGGITLGNSSGTPQSGNASEDVVAKLQQAKEMLENKLITDSEYESIKARLISGL
jgi:hypothetical protein